MLRLFTNDHRQHHNRQYLGRLGRRDILLGVLLANNRQQHHNEQQLGAWGGGIYCWHYCSPIITNNTVAYNTATFGVGAGIDCEDNSSATITNNVITGNYAVFGWGGGIECDNSSPTITNNAITGNCAAYGVGGGIDCEDNSSPIITNNAIAGNFVDEYGYGGGIECNSFGSPVVTNNTITDNSAINGVGAGIDCENGTPMIANNNISGNTADNISGNPTVDNYGWGGGIDCWCCSATITNNTIVGNSAANGWGAAICCLDSSSAAVSNNIVAFNSSGIYNGTDGYYPAGAPTFLGDDVYGNTDYNFSGVTNPTGSSANISTDPLFVNAVSGNYRLSPGSPCVSAGSIAVVTAPPFLTNTSGVIIDLDGNPRIAGGMVDMGAYEYLPAAPSVAITSPTRASTYLTGSGTIDLSGTASGVAGITQVEWYDDMGGEGSCTGTSSWTASNIALQPGGNVITITATDSAGNMAPHAYWWSVMTPLPQWQSTLQQTLPHIPRTPAQSTCRAPHGTSWALRRLRGPIPLEAAEPARERPRGHSRGLSSNPGIALSPLQP